MSRLIVFTLAFVGMTVLFWVGGFDFNERGPMAVLWIVLSFFAGTLAATYPGKFPGEKE